MNSTFTYESLEGREDTIRLLRASRHSPNEITWSLEFYKLGSLPRRPFTALSYTWGDPTISREILIDKRPFRVILSVHAVLEAIRENPSFASQYAPDADSWWWIDGICINQNDAAERTSQVQLMGKIYRHGHRTVGWLGRGASGTDDEDDLFTERAERAIQDLNRLCEYGEDIYKEPQGLAALREAVKLVDWPTAVEIWARPWWGRVWTLQEFLIPARFEYWCGKQHITREWMNTAMVLRDGPGRDASSDAISVGKWRRVMNRQRMRNWYAVEGAQLPLIALIAYGCDCEATDPRDRIFSVLTLATRKCDAGLIKANYAVEYTYQQAYTDLVIAFVRRHKSLDIICFTHAFHRDDTPGTIGPTNQLVERLPSWVPDWTAETWSYVVPVMASQTSNALIGNFRPGVHNKDKDWKAAVPYTASGTYSSECIFSIDRTTLICKGVIVDSISVKHGRVAHSGHLPINSTEASLILETMSRSLLLGRKDRYLVHALAHAEAYHDFRAFCHAASNKTTQLWGVFQAWFDAHEDFLIHGTSLKAVLQVSMADPDFARRYKKGKVDLSRNNWWLSRFGDIHESFGMARHLVGLQSGNFGMGSTRVRMGDKVCVLLGCSIPVVLRPLVDKEGNGWKWKMIGEFYLDHAMKGEALEVDADHFTIFDLV